jgi:hypothetical protein
MGISEADQASLFTKFFRVDNTSAREQSGTGLGLYITKHLSEAHKGAIWTESAIGEGTIFTSPGSGQICHQVMMPLRLIQSWSVISSHSYSELTRGAVAFPTIHSEDQ